MSRRPQETAEERFRRRVRVVAICLVALAVVPVWRLVGVVVGDGEALAARAERQSSRAITVEAARGSIVDRNGMELALTLPRVRVAVNTRTLAALAAKEPSAHGTFVSILARTTGADEEDLIRRIEDAQPDDPFVELIERVTPEQADEARAALLDAKLLDALVYEDNPERVNPSGGSGLRLVGTFGPDGPGPEAGVERFLDDALSGEPGSTAVELTPTGDIIAGSEEVVTEPVPGATVRLTIDRTIQYEAERILVQGAEAAGAGGGVAIVGRPSTGELLAVASVERDPTTGEVRLAESPKAFSDAYQAGSVFKLVPLSAALEDGRISPETTIVVPDRLQVYDRTFTDHDDHATRAMGLQEIIAQSSNVGTIKIAQLVGAERLHEALVDFGFGRRTGIANPAESAGVLPDVEDWNGPDLAASAIGTHQSATAVQLWAAYNVIANRGTYVAPRLIDRVIDADGEGSSPEPGTTRRVLSTATADAVEVLLRAVITEGTGKRLDVPGFPVAAKTGTSRMPAPSQKGAVDGYMWPDGRYHYLNAFTGYLPADDPQVSITVLLEDTTPGLTGASGAGPVFVELAQLGIRELGIAPVGSADAGATVPLRAEAARAMPSQAPASTTAADASTAVAPTTVAPEDPAGSAPGSTPEDAETGATAGEAGPDG